MPILSFATEKGISGHKVVAIVRADSPYQKLSDLKGKKVAHAAPSSNSGNFARRVFLPVSCHSAVASQSHLTLTTTAFWPMHRERAAIPEGHALGRLTPADDPLDDAEMLFGEPGPPLSRRPRAGQGRVRHAAPRGS